MGNRQAWSKKLVEALARELSRRGAQIRLSAPLKLGIALPKVLIGQQGERYQFKLAVSVSSTAGWSKNYDAAVESGAGYFEPVGAMADRLAGLALAEAVRVMLSDAEFVAQLRVKQ